MPLHSRLSRCASCLAACSLAPTTAAARFPSFLGHLERLHSKSGRDRAADERPLTEALRVLPLVALDNYLGTFALDVKTSAADVSVS